MRSTLITRTITDDVTPTGIHNPPHPGEILRCECLDPLGLTVTRAAQGLGVTRQALSDLVNEKAGVSVEKSIRLSPAFGSTPGSCLGMQTAYDLWQVRGRAEHMQVARERLVADEINGRRSSLESDLREGRDFFA